MPAPGEDSSFMLETALGLTAQEAELGTIF